MPVFANQQWTRFNGERVSAGRGYYQDIYYIDSQSRSRSGPNTYRVNARVEGEGEPQIYGLDVNCRSMKVRWLQYGASDPWSDASGTNVVATIARWVCNI